VYYSSVSQPSSLGGGTLEMEFSIFFFFTVGDPPPPFFFPKKKTRFINSLVETIAHLAECCYQFSLK
jgi:hypothetical protein